MRRLTFLGLFVLGMLIGIGSSEVSGQVLKTDPKADPKAKAEPKQPEWPKKVMGKTLDQWVSQMLPKNQPYASMRDFAIKTLPMFGPDARKAASKNLIYVLNNEQDINVKLTAISMVPILGFDERDMDDGLNSLVAFIKPLTGTPVNHTRYEVTMALGKCGPIAKRAIPFLTEWTLIDPKSWQNRKAAAAALGRLGLPTPLPPDPTAKKDDPPKMSGPDVKAVVALAKSLAEDHSHQVRREAVQSLLLLGPPHNQNAWIELRKSLTKAFNDSDTSTRIWAHVCFIRSEQDLIKASDPNLQAIIKFTAHEEPSIRLEAIQAIGTIGNEAKSTLKSILIPLALDPSLAKIDVKEMTAAERDKLTIAGMAIWAMGQMTEEVDKLLPILEELQKHKLEFIKKAAKAAEENLLRKDDPKFVPKKDMKKP